MPEYHRNRLLKPTPTTQDTLCRRVREKLGISQEEFAKQIGVSPKTISKYEVGRQPLRIIQVALEKLAKRHGVAPPPQQEDRIK